MSIPICSKSRQAKLLFAVKSGFMLDYAQQDCLTAEPIYMYLTKHSAVSNVKRIHLPGLDAAIQTQSSSRHNSRLMLHRFNEVQP